MLERARLKMRARSESDSADVNLAVSSSSCDNHARGAGLHAADDGSVLEAFAFE